MDKQRAVDRILETENLTDNLEDDEANWLINWGVGQVDSLLAGAKDDDEAGEKISQLMDVMRHLNRLIPRRDQAASEDVQAFLDKYQQAFGQAVPHHTDEHAQAAGELADKTPLDAIQHLLNFAGAKPTLPNDASPKKAG